MNGPARRACGIASRALLILLAAALAAGCRSPGPARFGPAATPAANVSSDPWVLETRSPIASYGGYLGNGYLGMRFGASGTTFSPDGSAPSGAMPSRSRPLLCFMAGLYAGEQLVAAPNWGLLVFGSSGNDLVPETGGVTGYSQSLDLRRGELTTRYRSVAGGPGFTVDLTTRVHRDNVHLVTFVARVTPDSDGLLSVKALPAAASPAQLRPVPAGSGVQVWDLRGASPGVDRYITLVDRLDVRDDAGRIVAPARVSGPARLFPAHAHRPMTFIRWVYVQGSRDARSATAARAALDRIRDGGIEAAARAHRAAWRALWASDIKVDGDVEAQQALHASMFALLCSASPHSRWSIPPMGLSGLQWGGHIFWDADTWMFAALGLLHPELARPIVEYRFATLPGARANARARGYLGADFATESAVSGREMAPAEFPFERHNTADVAIAQWRDYLLSGDRRRLDREGWPILRDTADYWRSRVAYDAPKKRYEIRHVISPDETARFVDDDVYTNAAAQLNLRYAVAAARLLGHAYPPEWVRIADRMRLPFDPVHHRYLEHDGDLSPRLAAKQADAQLIFFPLGLPAPPEVVANTLDYYALHTSPLGPAMTSSVNAVIAAHLASAKPSASTMSDRSLKFFHDSYRPFVRPPFDDFSEKRSNDNATFLTGCAGVVMSALYGFGGISFDAEGIRARPILPPGWRRLRITGIHYRGRVYELDLRSGRPPRFASLRAR